MSEGERLRRAAVDARRREASDGVMREWTGCGYEARAYLDHIIGEEDAPAGHKPRALGTSPDPVHPLRGRATSHLSDPLDPYAQAGALEREAARLRDELERVRCDVVRMATALAETQPETARRLMALLEDE